MINLEPQAGIAELINVSKTFHADHSVTYAVRNVSLTIRAGELVLLLGPSGSGKTTLLTLMAGFLMPSSGSVMLFDRNIGEYGASELQDLRARHLGFIFQNFHLIDSLTVRENILLVQEFIPPRDRSAGEARALLEKLGITHLTSKLSCELSQGEKQRVAIARALSNSATFLLADEPTASLETGQGYEIIQLLHELAKRDGRSVVVASHDLRLVPFSDRVLRMADGRILDDASGGTLTAAAKS